MSGDDTSPTSDDELGKALHFILPSAKKPEVGYDPDDTKKQEAFAQAHGGVDRNEDGVIIYKDGTAVLNFKDDPNSNAKMWQTTKLNAEQIAGLKNGTLTMEDLRKQLEQETKADLEKFFTENEAKVKTPNEPVIASAGTPQTTEPNGKAKPASIIPPKEQNKDDAIASLFPGLTKDQIDKILGELREKSNKSAAKGTDGNNQDPAIAKLNPDQKSNINDMLDRTGAHRMSPDMIAAMTGTSQERSNAELTSSKGSGGMALPQESQIKLM